jgi:hypothetical protein
MHIARAAAGLAATAVALVVVSGSATAAPSVTAAAKSAPVNAALPAISGTARQGQTLTASSGSWGGTLPITYAYQWQRCNSGGTGCTSVTGAASATYLLVSADVGHTMRVRVTASNSGGDTQAFSAPTGMIADLGNAPAATSQPNPSGTTIEGQTLTASDGTWSGTQPITFTYHWQQCTATACTDIKDATEKTYVIVKADVGFRLRYHLTASNSVGKGSIDSNLSDVVAAKGDPPKNVTPPIIIGTVSPGKQVHASAGEWAGANGASFVYAWLHCAASGTNCTLISGEDSPTYTVRSADSGGSLRARVTAKNAAGSTPAESPAVPVTTPPSGNVVPVSSLTARPDHLLIKDVKFSPSPFGNPGGSFTLKVHVILEGTTKGVSGALVQVTGIPYNWVKNPPETPTGSDGWVTLKVGTTKSLPHSGALVMQIRARGPGNTDEDILGGFSTRRLVQLSLK